MFLITSIHFSEASDQFVRQRLNLMFPSELVSKRLDLSQWIYKRYIKEDKEARRVKYLAVYIMNDWLSKNKLVQRSLSYATNENRDLSNEKFYEMYISSSVFNESVNQALQSKDFNNDKKIKKSLKRLYSRIQDFQRNLNILLSYEVQVSIVLRVLNEFKDVK